MVQKGQKRGPMSAEHKAKISAANLGRKLTDEQKAKISAAGMGCTFDDRGGIRATNTGEVLWSKVDRRGPDECWPWLGYRSKEGYGRAQVDGKMYYAHRIVYDLTRPGVIAWSAPADRRASGFLRHACDNPSCCNPAHMLVGTQFENSADKITRGRSKWWNRSTESANAKLSVEAVHEIRRREKTRRQYADQFGVSISTIKGVLSGRHYSDV